METLKKNYEFKNVLTRGKYFGGRQIEIYCCNNKKNSNFIGIAVQKKVAKAVQRNRIKRLIRENYRALEGKITKGVDIVFLWKKNIPPSLATFDQIEEDMLILLKKAKLI